MNFKNMDIFGIVGISQVGQIIIPKEARDAFNLQYGEHIIVGTHRKHKKQELIIIKEEQFYKCCINNDKFNGFRKFEQNLKRFGVVKAGKKGQVVIPKKARDEFNITSKTKFFMIGFRAPNKMYHIILLRPKLVKEFAMKLMEKLLDYNDDEK